jgi:hypothetical protein
MTADSLGRDGLGFPVWFSVNAPLSEFKSAVAGLAAVTRDVLLIHFCGPSAEVEDESYLEFSNGDRFGGAGAAEWLSSLSRAAGLKVVLLCESESEGACGLSGRYLHLRPEKSPRGAIGLFPCSSGGKPTELGVFTFGVLKCCVTEAASPRAIERSLEAYEGVELGMETTSWCSFERPLLSEGAVETPAREVVELNPRTGRLMVLCSSVTRAMVEAHKETARKLVLRDAMMADGGVFAGFVQLEVAELRSAGLVGLPTGAFENAEKLCSVALPCWMASISDRAFAGCSRLASLVGKGVVKVGREAFRGAGLQCVDFGAKTLIEVGEGAFADSALTEASLPATTEVVGAGAFERCRGLKVASLPRRVGVVAKSVFGDCTALRKLTVGDQIREWQPGCFAGCQGTVQELYLDGEDADKLQGWQLRPALAKDCVLEYPVGAEVRRRVTRGGYAASPVNMLQEEATPDELRAFLAEGEHLPVLNALRKNAREVKVGITMPQSFVRSCYIVVQGTKSLGASTVTDAVTFTDFLASQPGRPWKKEEIYFTIETRPSEFQYWVRHFAGCTTGLAIIFFAGHGLLQLQGGKPNGNEALVLSKRSGLEDPEDPVWTEPTLEGMVSGLKKDPRSKVLFLTDACHSGGVYGMRTDMATRGLLGLSAALRAQSELSAVMKAGEGEQGIPRGVFTYCLVRLLKKDPKVTPEGILKPLDEELARYGSGARPGGSPQRLGLETTETRLFKEPILEERLDVGGGGESEWALFDDKTGTLTITPPGTLTRAGVQKEQYRKNTRHLIVRCGVGAEGGVLANFEAMEDADFSDSTLVDLPAEPAGGRGFFEGCTKLKKIVLPRKLAAFTDRLFENCISLRHLVVSARVASIGVEAFAGSGLAEIGLEHVTALGDGCFKGCRSLTRVVLSPVLRTIGAAAFAGSGLRAVDLQHVTGLGEECFANSSLEVVKFGDALSLLPKRAFAGTKLKSVKIVAAQKIGEQCFAESALMQITFGRGLVEIGEGAFAGTGIMGLEIPESVTVLGGGIFEACGELARAVLPGNTLRVPERTFRNCRRLTQFTYPPGVTCVGASAFSGCMSLVDPGLSGSVNVIETEAFRDCTGLARLRLPDGIVEIGSGAFQGCTGLKAIQVGGGVSCWGRGVFRDCGQKATTLALRGPAFCENWSAQLIPALDPACVIKRSGKPIEVVGELSNGRLVLKNLGDVRWYSLWCHRARTKAVYVVGSTRLIGAVFCMAAGIKSINMTGVDPTRAAGRVEGHEEEEEDLEVRMDKLEAEGELGLASDCTALSSLALPPHLQTIGEGAWSGCIALKGADLRSPLTQLGPRCFSACTALGRISIPSGVKAIPEGAFDSSGVTQVTLPDTVRSIGRRAFANSLLTGVTLPDGVTVLWDSAFDSPTLRRVSIGSQVARWGVAVFGTTRRIGELDLRGDDSCGNWHPQIEGALADDCRITINGRPPRPYSGSQLALSGCGMVRWVSMRSARKVATSITIGRGVAFAPGVFANFAELLHVDMTDSDLAELPSHGEVGLFRGLVKLRSCKLSSQLRTIGPFSFAECGALREITITDGVRRIASSAFSRAGLERVRLPPSLRIIESSAFVGTKLLEVDIPDGVQTIDSFAFGQTRLERVVLPPSLRIIGASAFAGTNLREVDIPDSVMEVGERAFDCPNSLERVALGEVSGRRWGRRCFGGVECRDRRIKVEYRGRDSQLIPSELKDVATECRGRARAACGRRPNAEGDNQRGDRHGQGRLNGCNPWVGSEWSCGRDKDRS